MNLIKKLPRLFWLNILWLLCCFPLVTIGASTCAAYAVTLRIADEDNEVAGFKGVALRFFKAFKQDLVQGFLMFLFSAVSLGLGGFFIYLVYDSGFSLLKLAGLIAYFIIAGVFNLYSYPLIARYTNSFVNVLRNSMGLFLQYINLSFRTLVIVAVEIVVLYFSRHIYFAGLLIIPSLIFYTVSIPARYIFVRLENPVEEAESEESDRGESDEGLAETSESQE